MRIEPGGLPCQRRSRTVWYSSSRVATSYGKGGSEDRKERSGCENREATSSELRIGFAPTLEREYKQGWGCAYSERIVENENDNSDERYQ